MTPFDLTLLLLLSNSVQNAMTGPDTSLLGGAVAAATLLILNYRRCRHLRQEPAYSSLGRGRAIAAHPRRQGH